MMKAIYFTKKIWEISNGKKTNHELANSSRLTKKWLYGPIRLLIYTFSKSPNRLYPGHDLNLKDKSVKKHTGKTYNSSF